MGKRLRKRGLTNSLPMITNRAPWGCIFSMWNFSAILCTKHRIIDLSITMFCTCPGALFVGANGTSRYGGAAWHRWPCWAGRRTRDTRRRWWSPISLGPTGRTWGNPGAARPWPAGNVMWPWDHVSKVRFWRKIAFFCKKQGCSDNFPSISAKTPWISKNSSWKRHVTMDHVIMWPCHHVSRSTSSVLKKNCIFGLQCMFGENFPSKSAKTSQIYRKFLRNFTWTKPTASANDVVTWMGVRTSPIDPGSVPFWGNR